MTSTGWEMESICKKSRFVTLGHEKSVILMGHYFWSSWSKQEWDSNSRFLNKIKYAQIPMDRYVKSIFDYSPENTHFRPIMRHLSTAFSSLCNMNETLWNVHYRSICTFRDIQYVLYIITPFSHCCQTKYEI